MAVITILSGSYCRGEEVAAGVASRLRYERVDEQLLELAAERSGVSTERLSRTIMGPPPFLNRVTHERQKNLAHLRAAMARIVRQDDVVYHGVCGLLVPREITHVLRICVIANLDYRVALAVKQDGLTERQATKTIHAADRELLHWANSLHLEDPYGKHLYDLLLAMQSTTVESAIEHVCGLAARDEITTTAESMREVENLRLAAEVELALAPKGYDVEVTCSEGEVTIALDQYVARLDAAQRQLETAAATVPGVRSARCVPGKGFVPPSLVVPSGEFDPPSKILLVDDEREFVLTLSERLRDRNLETAVVYDGEEALSFVATDEPEVMVLDLKMPGIDGIEVLRRVKKEHPDVEVIILTGHGSKKEEELAKQLGAFAYLRKPVDIDLLTSTMKRAYRKTGKRDSDGGRPSKE